MRKYGAAIDMTLPFTEITISLPWGKLAAKAWGPENGRRVLALHGWLDNAASFDRLLPLLPPSVRVVALDLPGHGHSDHRPPGTTYHFVDSATDMFAVMDGLGWERASLLGHSLGGAIASLLAGVWPDRIERLALIEALGPLTAPAEEFPERVGLHLQELRKAPGKHLPVYASVEEAAAARLKIGGLSKEAALILATRGTKPVAGGVTWRSDPRLRLTSSQRLIEEQVEAYLQKIKCPALLLRGKEGLPIDPTMWDRRTRAVSQLKVTVVPGGHHLHLDRPEVAAPELSAFLNCAVAPCAELPR